MQALVVASRGSVSLVELDDPAMIEGEVIVAPQIVGMCGTDLELIDGSIDPAYVRYPLVLGHEWVGVLETDVVGVAAAGERVVVEGVIACDVCPECRRGDTNRCVTYDEIGFTRPGAIAGRVAVPSRLVHRIDPSVDPFDAVLVEPMAVVWRALTRFALRRGLRVAVVGDGTIALLTAHMVRLFEPTEVVVVGRREAQADLARRAGADAFTTSTPEGRFDLVVEAAGSASSAATAVALAERGGMVILLGLPAHGTVIDLAPGDVVNNDLVIQGSFSYTQLSWAQVVHRVNAGELRPSFLITHRYGLAESIEALSTLRGDVNESEPRGKVVVTL